MSRQIAFTARELQLHLFVVQVDLILKSIVRTPVCPWLEEAIANICEKMSK